MSLQRKLKNALDETRLLILGAQVLFGFQFNSMFQEAFADLHLPLRLTACAGLVLIMIATGLLIAPSMQHRIVERGEELGSYPLGDHDARRPRAVSVGDGARSRRLHGY
jgi:hypothetical protein